MDNVTLRYGQSSLSLHKSETLIGLRAAGAYESRLGLLSSAVVPAIEGNLGGFSLLNVTHNAKLEPTLDALRAHPLVQVGTHVYHSADDGVPFVPTGQLYLEFAPDTDPQALQELLFSQFLMLLEARGEEALIVGVTARSPNPIKVAKTLQESGLVTVAEPELASPAALQSFRLPSDPLLPEQWHLENSGFHRGTRLGFVAGADARVRRAWEAARTLGSPNVIVAVIDNGYDMGHPEITGSGKVVAPWDFTRNHSVPHIDFEVEGWQGGHGTAVAGVAVGAADSRGIVGAAPHARLMPIRWDTALFDSGVERWFDYVREQGAHVVNCSWAPYGTRYPLSTRMHRAIERAAREGRGGLGCVVVFAAGNSAIDIMAENTFNGFAAHPDVIAVSASTSQDTFASYSNYGSAISICAPSNEYGGWGITTADVRGSQGYSTGDYTDNFGGTSSSAPLVAGICALILSVRPTLTALEVKRLLERTARRIGTSADYDARGHSIRFGFGCVNAESAVRELLGAAPPSPTPPPTPTPPSNRRLVYEGQLLSPGWNDYHTFGVASPARYTLQTTGNTDVVVTLYRLRQAPQPNVPLAIESQIGEDDNSGGFPNARIIANLTPGHYLVWVRHRLPSGTGSYRLEVTW